MKTRTIPDITRREHRLWVDEDGPSRFSFPLRYAWPSELDLMARIAGLELQHRWEDWYQKPFDRHRQSHVSVWRRAAKMMALDPSSAGRAGPRRSRGPCRFPPRHR